MSRSVDFLILVIRIPFSNQKLSLQHACSNAVETSTQARIGKQKLLGVVVVREISGCHHNCNTKWDLFTHEETLKICRSQEGQEG